MADMGLEERWRALGEAVDVWLDREAEVDRLSDADAAERWRAVSPSKTMPPWSGGGDRRRTLLHPCA